jgi:hypothetical protein
MATGSEFDHVGIVVISRKSDQPMLMESTAEGVTLLPLASRLKAYDYFKVSQYIVIRQFTGPRVIYRMVS